MAFKQRVPSGQKPRSAAPQPKRSGFVYTPRDPDEIKARSERSTGRFDTGFRDGFDLFRPKNGTSVVRILPPTWMEGAGHYAFEIWVHKWIGADGGTFLCLRKMQNKPCPICESCKAAKDEGDAEEEKALRVSEMNICWVLSRDDENSTTPKIYGLSANQDKEVLNQSINPKTKEVLYIDDPDVGYDLIIRRSGQGLLTKYSFSVDRDPSPLADDAKDIQDIMAYIEDNPIPSVLQYHDYDYLASAMSGTVETPDEELGGEEAETEAEPEEEQQPISRRTARRQEPEPELEEEDPNEDPDIDADPEPEPEQEPERRQRVPAGQRRAPVREEPESKPRQERRTRQPDPEPELNPEDEEYQEDEPVDEPPPRQVRRNVVPARPPARQAAPPARTVAPTRPTGGRTAAPSPRTAPTSPRTGRGH